MPGAIVRGKFACELLALIVRHTSRPVDDRESFGEILGALAHAQYVVHRSLVDMQISDDGGAIAGDATADDGYTGF